MSTLNHLSIFVHEAQSILQQIDLIIFVDPQRDCQSNSDDIPITESCTFTKRLCTASMYLHALKSSTTLSEEERNSLFVQFNEDIYQSLLDDTAHFSKQQETD